MISFQGVGRRGSAGIITVILIVTGLGIFLGIMAAQPAIPEEAARAEATQREFRIDSLKILMDQGYEMSVGFGKSCSGTFFLKGGRGDLLEVEVPIPESSATTLVKISDPSVAKLKADKRFDHCWSLK